MAVGEAERPASAGAHQPLDEIERVLDGGAVRAEVLAIIAARGKMQNPVTGSGGMLLGRVKEIGPKHPARETLKPGDRIATLVSLSLTPLVIEEMKAVHPEIDRVDIRGRAILFASGIYAKLHVVEQGETAPTREIIRFMFPRKDVVFIAQMEYPFGETRSIDQDWKYILWNFEFEEAE